MNLLPPTSGQKQEGAASSETTVCSVMSQKALHLRNRVMYIYWSDVLLYLLFDRIKQQFFSHPSTNFNFQKEAECLGLQLFWNRTVQTADIPCPLQSFLFVTFIIINKYLNTTTTNTHIQDCLMTAANDESIGNTECTCL